MKRTLVSMLSAIILLTCTAVIASAAGFEYPSQETKSAVVYPQNANATEVKAAETLAYYLYKITGSKPDCVPETKNISRKGKIFVGRTIAEEEVLGDFNGFPKDGYRIRTQDGALYLCGSSPIGTLNAVTGLLTDKFDVFWGMPNPLWESVPRKDKIALPDMDEQIKPAYGYRICSGVTGMGRVGGSALTFEESLRTTRGHYEFEHNMMHIVKDSEYAKTHPEYFSIIDGRRMTSADSGQQGQPCFTNSDVFKLSVQAARKALDSDPTRNSYSLCINDTGLHCECPKCAALDAPRKMWRGAVDYSNSYYDYLYHAAKLMQKTHPNKDILAWAYWSVVCPPRNIDKFTSNVHIGVTQDLPQHVDSEYRKADMDMLNEWHSKVSKLSVYVYMNLGWITPKYLPHVAGEYLKAASDMGSLGIYCDTNPNWVFQAPQVYTMARQMWDPSLKTDDLLNHYFKAMFKDQAPAAAQFYSIMEQYYSKQKGEWFSGFGKWEPEAQLADAALFEKGVNVLRQALSESKDPEVAARFNWMLTFTQLPELLILNEADMRTWNDKQNPPDFFGNLGAVKTSALAMLARDYNSIPTAENTYIKDKTYSSGYYKGGGLWSKLHTAFQNTQYAFTVGALNAIAKQASRTGSLPNTDEARKCLEEVRYKGEISKYSDNPQYQHITDAADMLSVFGSSKVTPKIDGDLSDWNGQTFHELLSSPGPYLGKWDAPCSAAVTWDDAKLYLAVRVPKSEHIQSHTDSKIWAEDSIQIAIDPLFNAFNQRGYGHYDSDDLELGFALTGDKIISYCYTTEKPTPAEGYSAAIAHKDNQTSYEVVLPWSKIMPSGKKPDGFFGMNVVVNGSDGIKRRACGWSEGLLSLKDPRLFAHIWLGSR